MLDVGSLPRDKELSEIRKAALQYLARREHSRLELSQKLFLKYPCHIKIAEVLNQVESDGFLSDQRFADLIVRSRTNACYGPIKIKMELRAKGVASDVIESVLNCYDIDWFKLAISARKKHFGEHKSESTKLYFKQMRYLQGRGFNQNHIDTAMANSYEDAIQ